MVEKLERVPTKAMQLTEHDDLPDDEIAATDMVPRKPQTYLTLAILE
jgi:hypothetical protein